MLLLAAFVFFTCACNSTKRIPEGSYLVSKVRIKTNGFGIHISDLEPFVKQKPNRKALGKFPLGLWVYNLANPERLKIKTEKYKAKMAAINAARVEQGKDPKPEEKLFLEQALMNIGEPPVIYDSSATLNTVKQFERFCKTKGYFNCSVKDSVVLNNKRAQIYYTLQLGKPYRIQKIKYDIEDKSLLPILANDSAERKLAIGKLLDLDQLQRERDRITRKLNNHGYFAFSKEFIYFKLDTSFNTHEANIELVIKQNIVTNRLASDSAKDFPHLQYTIKSITIQEEEGGTDTLHLGNISIIYKKQLIFKPKLLTGALSFYPGSLYQADAVEATYRRLSQLRAFKTVAIQFELCPGTLNQLQCKIALSAVKKQNFTIAAEGSNTGGDLGIMGNVSYQNKNLFGGAEVFELKIKGGLEVQELIYQSKPGINTLNTKEFGPEVNLNFPRFIFNTKTTFSLLSNYQESPDYSRLMNKVTFGYTWKIGKKITHIWNPLELGYIKVNLDPAFESLINGSNNILLENSYQPHLVPDGKYTFIYNDQVGDKSQDHHYLRFSLESSGNVFRGLFSLAKVNTDANNSYEIDGIPFSQYLRTDVDYRYYKRVSDGQNLVFRFAGGIGKTLPNLETLPFEKSFYGGGSNDIRAWPIRTLGPGSFSGNTNFSQIGDMQLEGNFEYRFKLLRQLNGAWFVDAGNIWLLHPNATYPGGDFQADRFYKEIAVGSGFGARFDFSFFIVRLDLGIKLRDPQLPDGDRWVIQHLFDNAWLNQYSQAHGVGYSYFNFNLGIGYPF